jgi:D-lactate dehydrogenase
VKIVFFEINESEEQYVREHLKGHDMYFCRDKLSPLTVGWADKADAISVMIYSKINKEILDRVPTLKFVSTRTTGFDHIDLAECAKMNIVVTNVPFYGENTVAEHTFALILSLSRNIHKSYVRTLQDNFSIDGLMGFDLQDKTIGIIGGGHIGLHVARMAKAFGMHVRVFDMNRQPFLAEVMGFSYVDMDTILRTADIITLHVPYNPHTHHLINRDSLSKMKKGAILINTARGGVVDTDALLEALETKHLAGAGLDVL